MCIEERLSGRQQSGAWLGGKTMEEDWTKMTTGLSGELGRNTFTAYEPLCAEPAAD